MTTTTETYHDIEPFAITDVDGRASARCLTHMTSTTEKWGTFGAAAREFICDEQDQRFVTEFHGADIDVTPAMHDLSGLARAIRSDAESNAYGQSYGYTEAWLWHPGGRTEPLTIKLGLMTGFNEDDWATQEWAVHGEDGRLITTVPVRIDGRA